VSAELNKILIKYDQPGFKERFIGIRAAVFSASHLDGEREEQLDDILNEVSQRGDEAVAEYTEKFDGVKLTPEQFKISDAELKTPTRQSTKNF
jgi:histidinol dehydrogenase